MKKYVTLGEVCRLNMGQSPDSSTYNDNGEGIPFYQGNADFGELHPITAHWCTAPTKIAYSGDILISVRAPIGALNIATEKCCIGRGLAAITVDEDISRDFIWYMLQSRVTTLQAMGTGSTFKAINKNVLNDMRFLLPSLDRQKKIAVNLSRIDTVIRICTESLNKLDMLVKSRFVEMFGDPILNQKGFPVYKMDEVVEFQGGSQPDKKYFEFEATEDNIRLIQIRDYKTDKYITYIPKVMAKRFCTADDIMIGRYGPPIFQILQGIEGSFNVALMKATPKMGNKEFVRYFLKQDCLLHYLEGMSKRTAGQDGIQMDKLKAYPFPMPPIELQNQFAAFVEQTDKSKLAVKQVLEKAETLKKALMQEYFG